MTHSPIRFPRSRSALAALAVLCALSSPVAFAQNAGKDVVAPPHPQNDPTRPDPDDGNQAFLLPPPKPLPLRDLALTASGFRLGNELIPWGTSATIADTASAQKARGRCLFRYLYGTANIGPIASLATTNRVFRDTQAGPVLASAALPALAAGATANSSGHVSLSPGTWMLYVLADAAATNAESNEANNLRRVRVTVTGDCK